MPIRLEQVSYCYPETGAKTVYALKEIDLEIREGDFLFLIGHTGSGKSTLAQFLNALERPMNGQILYNGKNIWDKKFSKKELRKKVGLVFQYPEHQLFAETVLEDVKYGPLNLGLSQKEAEEQAKQALLQAGVGKELWEKSPFALSGGQQRKIAIAGILAMKPEYLVLDEPTAGLDPQGREDLFCLLNRLWKDGMTIVVISHSMEDVAKHASRVVVLDHGQKMYDMQPEELFEKEKELEQIGLGIPQTVRILHKLKAYGLELESNHLSLERAADLIVSWLKPQAG